jgi:V/A-type H+-transporting ATPase subunit F
VEYFVIGDEDTVLGFGMVGVRGRQAGDARGANAAIDEALSNPEIGIVIMTERVADSIRARIDHLLFSEDFPLIVEIPDRGGHSPGKPTLREMVNDAIGINV